MINNPDNADKADILFVLQCLYFKSKAKIIFALSNLTGV